LGNEAGASLPVSSLIFPNSTLQQKHDNKSKKEEKPMQSKQQPNKNLLFVYGLLKRGFDNHQLLKNATFIAKAKTLHPYSMFVETHGQYPYLLKNRPFH